jgi:DNA-binding CsgD family transcriptional regulator
MLRTNGPPEKLTPRELEVLKLIAGGLSTKEIGRSLGVTFKTAACHRYRIMEKLNIHEVANLTRYAIRNGYVDLGSVNGRRDEIPPELFQRVRTTEADYRRALEEYGAFLQGRETIGLSNPDGSSGARRLRQAEEFAHQEYHAAGVALKDFLLRNDQASTLRAPQRDQD